MSQLDSTKPPSYKEATSQQVCVDAMIEEYNSIMKNDVWEVAPRPIEKSIMTIDPVSRYSTFRTIILLVALFGWKLHQTDVKTVLLNKVEAYVEQPEGFVKKSLYAPRFWYARMDGLIDDLGFSKSTAKSNLYFEVVQNHVLILVLYADDLFLTGPEQLIEQCKRQLTTKFEMKDLELVHYFLGLEDWKNPGNIFLTQGKYVGYILQRFGMQDCKYMGVPMTINLTKLGDIAISS